MGFVIRATGGRVILIHVAKQNGYESCLLFSPNERSVKNVIKENARGMQDDMISRQAATDALRKMQTYKLFSGDDMLLIDQAGAQTELMLLPPIQPKRGRWILDRSGAYCCSKCMEPCATYVMMKPRDKFCKMCGSRNEVTT